MKKKLIITGASGFLGWNVVNMAISQWDVYGIYFNHDYPIPGAKLIKQDITDQRGLHKVFAEIQPDAVIHTAAASQPDYCETHSEISQKTNIDASIYIAEFCSHAAIPLVFTSTDLVFDGLNPPYKETSQVNPISVYGEHKVIAEEKIMQIYPETLICRMALMFGHSGSYHQNFTTEIVHALKNRKEIRLFSDEFRTPLDVQSASRGLLYFLCRETGIIHLGGQTRISRFDMGVLLADIMGCEAELIQSIRQKNLPMAAPRPSDVSLDISKAMSKGYTPDNLTAVLKKMVGKITLQNKSRV